MLDPIDLTNSLAKFAGRVPLFPLPNAAFYPHSLLPLHIFEPRYRRMVDDVLDGDGCIAMAQLKPGWEHRSDDELLPIYDYVCVGRIEAQERLPDGRHALILHGLSRARVLEEESTGLPYRVALVELRPDEPAVLPYADQDRRRRETLEAFRDTFHTRRLDQLFHEVTDISVSLGVVCDVVASVLSLSPARSQEILAEENVDRRCELVLGHLRNLRRKTQGQPQPRTFPPDFSAN
ncbi:MAG: LON peptidase substrate-binding domain-containing protein [Planctomycetaceae bacterium]